MHVGPSYEELSHFKFLLASLDPGSSLNAVPMVARDGGSNMICLNSVIKPDVSFKRRGRKYFKVKPTVR